MFRVSASFRLALGLAGSTVGVLILALVLGIVSDRQELTMQGRKQLVEAIAVNGSLIVGQSDLRRLETLLATVAERNDDILSAGVRRDDGHLLVDIGNHDSHWNSTSAKGDHDRLAVPIRSAGEPWGTVEISFQHSRPNPLWESRWGSWTEPACFTGGAGLLFSWIYLSRALRQLNVGHVVPSRVRDALDNLAEGLLLLDGHGRIALANQAFAALVNRRPQELTGLRASDLPWRWPDMQETGCRLPWDQALAEQRQAANVSLELRTDHSLRTFMVNASPVLGPDGRCRGTLVSLDDVTQLEQTKIELRMSKEAAEKANEAKSEFLARMSHEIRTPMNAILGYTEVLRRGFDENEADRQEYLDTIHTSGEHLLALINDILDLSKIESGRMELEITPCSPYKILAHVISVLRVRAKEKGLKLSLEVDGKIPETIHTDPTRLRQIIMNLVGNAIKFTQAGEVRIVTRLVDAQPDGVPDPGARTAQSPVCAAAPRPCDVNSVAPRPLAPPLPADPVHKQLIIDVIDTGIGIPPESMQRVFEPFVQADTSITRRFGGTGLGLSISLRLAQALGGGITVDSTPGQGSTFRVTLDPGPLEGIRLVDQNEAQRLARPQHRHRGASQRLPRARILVVDDGPANRKLLKLVLQRAGAEVETAENGDQAVHMALDHPYDVILMDMQMPVMDGYTASRMLRDHGYASPIIALTAHAMSADETKCRAAGCSGFLTKPLNMDLLVQTVADELEDRGHAVDVRHMLPAAARRPLLQPITGGVAMEREQRASAVVPAPCQLAGRFHAPPTHDGSKNRSHSSPHLPAPANGLLSPDGRCPLVSTLPMDDEEFCEIVSEFAERLQQKLAEMRDAYQAGDFEALVRAAHWLKGSGGTVGLDAFTCPARQLEQCAKQRDRDQILTLLDCLESLARRIEVPAGRSVA